MMNKYIYEGKSVSDLIVKAKEELKVNEDDLIVKVLEEKQTLLKKSAKIEVVTMNDIQKYIKDTLGEIIKLMNIDVKFEIRRRDKNVSIKLFSDNNAVLIGKNGKNIGALQTIIRQIVSNQVNEKITIVLDVENYKEKREKNIIYLAKKTAREVAKTKVEVTLDSMNSYERRIVHSVLADDKYVYTESVGEEPNRCVVIKLKEEQ